MRKRRSRIKKRGRRNRRSRRWRRRRRSVGVGSSKGGGGINKCLKVEMG